MDFSILLSKILPLLVYPLGLGVLLGVFALFLIALGRRKLAFCTLLLALLVVAIPASQPVSHRLMLSLEKHYPAVDLADAPLADAIVVLGGGVVPRAGVRLREELAAGGQRLLHTARLFKASRAPIVVVSGGNTFAAPGIQNNAEAATLILGDLGVPKAAITADSVSRNTYENAVETANLLKRKGLRRILLVTSAYHMPRAMAVFRSRGVDAMAQPTDYWAVSDGRPSWVLAFPNSYSLGISRLAIKEYLGYAIYRWRDWIKPAYGYYPGAGSN